MKQHQLILLGCVSALALAACGGGGGSNGTGGGGGGGTDTPTTPPPVAATPKACADLVGMEIPASAIGLPTSGGKVTAATVTAAAGTGAAALPEYCNVLASIAPVDPTAPSINFRLALPTAWNKKAVMFGGGGFDGTLPNVAGNVPAGPADKPTPLGRGYATFASDSGHQANAAGSLDGQFLLNDEAFRNFGGHALKKTHDAALYLI